MSDKITRAQAEQALAAVKDRFRTYLEAGYTEPVLVEDWDWLASGPTPWAIVWEEGPDEWAYHARQGGTDHELSGALNQSMGVPEAAGWPEGVWCEPVNTWSVGLYPG